MEGRDGKEGIAETRSEARGREGRPVEGRESGEELGVWRTGEGRSEEWVLLGPGEGRPREGKPEEGKRGTGDSDVVVDDWNSRGRAGEGRRG